MRLWYRRPARSWLEALPIGNGRLGAMVFGGLPVERLQLNEETLWAGGPVVRENPAALGSLPEVRRLLAVGRHAEATALAERDLLGVPSTVRPFQTLGDLWIELEGAGDAGYVRELDLDTAIARVAAGGGGREAFVSVPDGLLVLRLQGLRGRLRLGREADAGSCAAGAELRLRGACDGGAGLRFCAHLVCLPDPGATVQAAGEALTFAGDVTVCLAAATSYRGGDPDAACRSALAASARGYAALRTRHIASHRALQGRVTLTIAPEPACPTDELGPEEPALAALHFQFGRHLLLCSSRPGSLPANLQGLWTDGLRPPWNSDYHTNINLQMNYWAAETCNLTECAEPLLDFIDGLRAPGARTAAAHYGCRGFVVHHLTDAYGCTTPCDGVWGIWPMGAAWLCQHLWEHYAFSGDLEFLRRRAYPVLREAARFLCDFLIEGPGGHLVTSPSHSPENRFRLPDGSESMFCVGATMDMEITWDLLTHCRAAATLLGLDDDLVAELGHVLDRLPPLRVGRHGQLQEWLEDYEEAEPGHRHFSHLFALHPGAQITPDGTPLLAAAARRTLERRLAHGGGHTGWSRAWMVSFWARLHVGDEAHRHLVALLRDSTTPSLLDLHPPQIFQMDGNLGATAGVAEMLLQSHTDAVHLAPALPPAWAAGSVRGLRARGGFEVDLDWRRGLLEHATVRAGRDGRLRLRAPVPIAAGDVRGPDGVLDIPVRAGDTVEVTAGRGG